LDEEAIAYQAPADTCDKGQRKQPDDIVLAFQGGQPAGQAKEQGGGQIDLDRQIELTGRHEADSTSRERGFVVPFRSHPSCSSSLTRPPPTFEKKAG